MQSLLTVAAQSVALFTVGYTVISFALYAWKRSAPQAVAPLPQPVAEPQSTAPIAADPWELPTEPAAPSASIPLPLPRLLLLPPAPVAEPELPSTIRELRKLCTDRGHKGAGRWTKAQCLAALAPVASPQPCQGKRRRKAQPAVAAAKFVPEYRVRAPQVRGLSI